MRLRAELESYKAGAEEEARAGDEARAEVVRLKAALVETDWEVTARSLMERNDDLNDQVNAQVKVIEAAREVGRNGYKPQTVAGDVALRSLYRQLDALDQATTPPSESSNAKYCGYESLPDEPGRFCRRLKGHPGLHAEQMFEAERSFMMGDQ